MYFINITTIRINILFGLSVWLILFLVSSCANKVSPTGGDKDIIPPVSTGAEPSNFSVNFKAKTVTVTFSEFIQLNDIQKNLIVSPIMDPLPEVGVKRKSMVIKLPPTLHENATYTMNFGDAIVDAHEGNAAKNFQYVFSTGPVLDSLHLSGNVFDANTLKTEKDIAVMLYADSIKGDSVPYNSLPAYFSRTDSAGYFKINNISPGFYKIFALKDGDNNYLFNRADEPIAFLFNTIEVPDSGRNELRLFTETPKLFLKKMTRVYPGKIVASFSAPANRLRVEALESTGKTNPWDYMQKTQYNDTCILWVSDTVSDSLKVIFFNGSTVIDTAVIKLNDNKKDNPLKGAISKKLAISNSTRGGFLELRDSLFLTFSFPVTDYDLKKITLLADSIEVKDPEYLFDTELKMNLKINYPFKQSVKYSILIPQGTFLSFNGYQNDSIKINFKPREETEYGSLSIKLSAIEFGFNYVIQLVDENEKIIRQAIAGPKSKIDFLYLDPGMYRIKIIYDGNGNKRWDTGNYLEKIQPERVFYYKEMLTIRSNWDLETEWVLLE